MWFDGSITNGLTGIGIVIVSPQRIETTHGFRVDKIACSNNQAEYEALIVGLEILIGLQVHAVGIFGDSQLVVNQVKGIFKCQSISILPYYVVALHLLSQFEIANVTHVLRFLNNKANDVAQKASNIKRRDNVQRDISQTTFQILIPPLNKRNVVLEVNHNDLHEQD